jgi:UDP-N-acetylglucosamine:LPS N-acetylglucosamine transferase
MMEKDSPHRTPPFIVILTLTCGGGHLQAARALSARFKEELPDCTVLEINLFEHWMGSFLGKSFTKIWNAPLQRGYSRVSLFLSRVGIPIFDVLFFIPIFINATMTFYKNPVTKVIDTQPVATAAVTFALLVTNKLKSKKLRLEKVLTELPTRKATHFFHPIKFLPKFLRRLIVLEVVETFSQAPEFWRKAARLKLAQVKLIQPPLRDAFFKLGSTSKDSTFELYLETKNREETLLLTKKSPELSGLSELNSTTLLFSRPANAFITTLMLGSQPHSRIIHEYLTKLQQLTLDFPQETTHLVFVLGNDKTPGWSKLKKQWMDSELPAKNFIPILLSMQNQRTVALLFHYSDQTITRSGGLTSMELLQAARGQVWIHTESEIKKVPQLKKMPPWEAGNAEILIKKLGAKVTTPNHLKQLHQ